MMSRVNLFSRRPFAAKFTSFLAEGPTVLTVVSPFVTAIAPWKSVTDFFAFAQRRGIESLELVTKPPNNKASNGVLTFSEADAISKLGVNLKIRDTNLHSKIYFFGFDDPRRYAAFVGSSNFTQGGFEVNDESNVLIQHPDELVTVRRELDRLCGQGSFPFHNWRARQFDHR
jgi:phosphatidylserine/phosphatidylglycerophosphate/cardiolipin synthase-like enzyme